MEIRQPIHSEHAKTLDTEGLRQQFLIEDLFREGEMNLTYSHIDRIIVGGIVPASAPLALMAGKALGVDFFLERRELGAINIGGAGKVIIDGDVFEIAPREAIYIGMGTRTVEFMSIDAKEPARFYINCAPAHHAYPSRKI
ncbi:5-dehydro-4-deoxy-D-glucuronate isomerase, partial [Providencia rettgeri]|nr:5-dehydro-4-deoxy-D-glucuronate isomerase [Providencia rettgeri]